MTAAPHVLALDTSTATARVALVDRATGARLAGREAISARHSSNLLALCAGTLADAGAALSDVAAIACGAGPGSFTGLRVGLAVAKGLALPTGISIVLVSSLEALALDLARAAGAGEALVPCLDAGKGEIYAALFHRSGPDAVTSSSPSPSSSSCWAVAPGDLPAQLGELVAAQLGDLGAVALGGPGAARYRDVLAAALAAAGHRGRIVDVAGPTAEAVGRLGLARLDRGDVDDLATAVPRYGRAPDITRPKRPTGG